MIHKLENINYFDGKNFKTCNVSVSNDTVSFDFLNDSKCESSLCIFPGFVDVHVHFREPGFSYKETIKSGSLAAAAGGYTQVCTMPNLNPVPDTPENIKMQLDKISADACIGVNPYASITKGQQGEEIVDISELKDLAIAFSDDGRGVQSEDVMEQAMIKAKENNKMIVAHCEVNSLLNGGYIHDGEYAKIHNHKGISSASEFEQIKRDIELAKKTGVKYHVCHISTAESVELIRKAKADGVDITCETAPHYLIFTDMDLQEDGRFKMNPPIRGVKDREALIEGIKDGTIDMIATDHAPHSIEEKSKGLEKSAMGVVGLETAFSALYTKLVKTGVISLERLISLLHYNPTNRFEINNKIEDGNFTIFDLNQKYIVTPDNFKTQGRATPFAGMELYGKCLYTFYNGKLVWSND